MQRLAIILAATAYALGAIYTFGLVYNRMGCEPVKPYECPADFKAVGSFMAAMFWPLSLSVIAQEEPHA